MTNNEGVMVYKYYMRGKMKKIVTLSVFLIISAVFCISSIAGVVYYNSNSDQISGSDYHKIAINWKNKASADIMQKVDAYLNGADISSIDTDTIIVENPDVVRQIRLEQWKRYRESGYK